VKAVIYPGPVVPADVGRRPTVHHRAGTLIVGEQQLPDDVADELVACGLVRLLVRPVPPPPAPEPSAGSAGSHEEPKPARKRAEGKE